MNDFDQVNRSRAKGIWGEVRGLLSFHYAPYIHQTACALFGDTYALRVFLLQHDVCVFTPIGYNLKGPPYAWQLLGGKCSRPISRLNLFDYLVCPRTCAMRRLKCYFFHLLHHQVLNDFSHNVIFCSSNHFPYY